MKQVAKCVVVFVCRHTPQDIPSSGGTPGFHGLAKRCRESVDNHLAFRSSWPLLRLFRWHLVDVDQIKHFLPHVRVAPADHVGIELVETQISFLPGRAVTTHAVFRQKRPDACFVVACARHRGKHRHKREQF